MTRPLWLRTPSSSPVAALAVLAAGILWGGAIVAGSPLAAATIAVDTLTDSDADDGLCSLREAIQAANDDLPHFGCPAGSGSDRLTIDLTGTIALTSDLPVITRTLTIVGPATGTLGINGANHRLLVLNGSPDGRTLRLERLTIRNGLHPTGGGCILVRDGDRLEVVDSRITGCETPGQGGAILGDRAASISLLRTTVDNSSAVVGAGGVFLIGEGVPESFGPAPDPPSAELHIEDSTISGNSVSSEAVGGGVVYFWANGEVRRSTVSGNATQSQGGGLVVIYGTVLVDSTTITSNAADTDLDDIGEAGGGLFVLAAAEAPATVTLHNSVVSNNFGAAQPSDIAVGENSAALSQGFNLIGVRDGADAFFALGAPNANDDWIGSRAAPVIAGLALLADNGGPTKTHAPSPGSLLVDHGECSGEVADQRAYGNLATLLRPVDQPIIPDSADGCDIGAFEENAEVLPVALFGDGFESTDTGAWSATIP